MSSSAVLHDYCRSQGIPVNRIEVAEGPHNKPSWIVTVILYGVTNPSAKSFISDPAPSKKAARDLAATKALNFLGLAIPLSRD
ncbi:hypothetical protein FRB94_002915 [Tulasnella sp. JGI-2019a]|nr:hypothetical protein FRB94_002915 [Tulasnella sp. JGI-2019a]